VVDPALARPAAVSVTGGRAIETGGLAPDLVAEAGATTWSVVRDSQVVQAPVGRVARVEADAGGLGAIVEVVVGCDVTALAATAEHVWTGTCDQPAASSGAELVEIDAAAATVTRRVPVPSGCIASVAAGDDHTWGATAPRVDAPTVVLRVAAGQQQAETVTTLAEQESYLGLAAGTDHAWVSVQTATESRLTRIDAATGEQRSVSAAPSRLLGVVERTLWTQELATSQLVARDTTSGAVTATVPIEGLTTAAAGPSGVWYQVATPGSTSVTIGRLDAAHTPTTVATYTGAGVDRTGTPYVGTLSVTSDGAWLAIQDRLFLLPA
jgi:hypothetical protein